MRSSYLSSDGCSSDLHSWHFEPVAINTHCNSHERCENHSQITIHERQSVGSCSWRCVGFDCRILGGLPPACSILCTTVVICANVNVISQLVYFRSNTRRLGKAYVSKFIYRRWR